MYCIKCGKEMRENSKFCSYCGTPAYSIQAPIVEIVEREEVPPQSKAKDSVIISIIGGTMILAILMIVMLGTWIR